jgi:molybdate transport system ATP-binding protein
MCILQVKNLSVSLQSKIIFQNISFGIEKGKQYAIVGASGTGKTTLLRCLAGQIFYKGTISTPPGLFAMYVEQQHHFKNLSNTASFYYQQRYNSIDAEDALCVSDYLPENADKTHEVLYLLGVDQLMNKRLIQLSNGENKRVQLAKALLNNPDLLLLDNPFLGLDVSARGVLNELFKKIGERGVSIIITATLHFIPEFITDVIELEKEKCTVYSPRSFPQSVINNSSPIKLNKQLLEDLTIEAGENFEYAVQMKNVHVQYGANVILDNIDWQVKKGDHWLLSGPNGAGKSTLLSLITADNPQAYANEIYLFDKRRGRGESIWDIKKRIGYVSPELHLYFEPSVNAFDVVASGLFDTIGLFRQLNDEQKDLVSKWMHLLQIGNLTRELLTNLSLGKQRLVLLARALVKNPPVLILDEPAQGLDDEQQQLLKNIIEQLCEHTNKTLIYVTHLRDEVPRCITKFIALEKGRIAQ